MRLIGNFSEICGKVRLLGAHGWRIKVWSEDRTHLKESPVVATDINVDARKGDGEERGSDDNTARPFKMDMAHVHARQNEESHRDWGGEEMLRIAAKMTRRWVNANATFKRDYDDLLGEAALAMVKADRAYDPAKCPIRGPNATRGVSNRIKDFAKKECRRTGLLHRVGEVRESELDREPSAGVVVAFENRFAEALGVRPEDAWEAMLDLVAEACDEEARGALEALRSGGGHKDARMGTTRWFHVCRRIGAIAWGILTGAKAAA